MSLPAGTVTFLFTDIEGSTRLMQELGDAYVKAQVEHHDILRAAFRSGAGRELRTEGDSFFCVFESAVGACRAAAIAQCEFAKHEWPQGKPVRVRVGLHTGEAPLVGNEYIGLDVHHAARVAAAAHGGQVVVSDATRALVEASLPPDLTLRDLGLHRLKDLARPERLFQLVIEGAPSTFPALRTLDSTPNNLPTQLTSFIGRQDLVDEAKRLLERTRLLTLTGPGGIGKTRLSLQVAAEVVQKFPDGVYFVALSAVRDVELIPSVVAQSIGLAPGNRSPMEAVIEHLKDRAVLLVLDNYEQLLPDGAASASQLLHASPRVKLLASSRAALRVYGEQELALQPLRVPDLKSLPSVEALSQYEAVKLFIERAVAAKHDFQVTNENAPAIAGICERVDGLPLAIELAAARVKLFNPQALLGRLESSVNVLGTGARDLPGRQQTLKGAIAWSYDLLDANRRRLFARFSAFARGAAFEQAEAVCGPESELGGLEVLTGLDDLADQSLLRRQPDLDEPRVMMLHVIREFALERLQESGEEHTIRDRHADAYTALAEAAAPNFLGPDQKTWLDRLERDHDNFRAAFDWSIAHGDTLRALRLGAAFWRFWQMRSHLREGKMRLDSILAMPHANDFPEQRLGALEAAGGVMYWMGDMQATQKIYDEIVRAVRPGGDPARIAAALYNASFPRMVNRSDLDSGLALLEEALPLFRQIGDEAGVARSQWAMGSGLHFRERYAEATAALDEAIPIFRKMGDRFSLGWALHTRTVIAARMADAEAAQRFVCEGLEVFRDVGDVTGQTLLLDDAASVALLVGDRDRASRLAGAATAHQVTTGAGLGAIVGAEEGRQWEKELAGEEAGRAWMEGQAMTLDQALAYALAAWPAVGASA